jgi:carboxymethylenebutenolidase
MSAANSKVPDLGAVFDAHIEKEFADQDVDATMKTMVPEPYVYCVPVATGAFGGDEVRRFYSEHFINQIPKDATVTPISRTIGKDQVVDEIIVSFTHNTQWDYLLPGIPPTGKHVNLPHVVVMKFEDGKVAHEHVWWDQASLCSCRLDCWIQRTYRWPARNKPERCCTLQMDAAVRMRERSQKLSSFWRPMKANTSRVRNSESGLAPTTRGNTKGRCC